MRDLKNCFTLACSVLLALGLSMAAQAQENDPVGWWTFEAGEELSDAAGNFPDIELKGAEIDNGALDVGSGKWAVTIGDYAGPDITDKTMAVWCSIDDLGVLAGSVMTIDKISADAFDGMVFGERQPQRWMAGSSNFQRTQDAIPGFEETKEDEKLLLVYTYEDDGGQAHIMLYRNGEAFGDYTQGPIITHTASDTEVFFGIRHGNNAAGGPGNLDAHIYEARIYNRVLSEADIAGLREGGDAVEAAGKLTTLWGAVKAK